MACGVRKKMFPVFVVDGNVIVMFMVFVVFPGIVNVDGRVM